MATKFVLPLLSVLALYTIFYAAETNGANKLIKDTIESGKLPESIAPIRKIYTGFAPLDEILTILVVFFWSVTDTGNVTVMFHSIGFSGAFGSSWVLVILEAYRRGNAWKAVAFPMIIGLVAQVMTFAVVVPLWCALQLFTSATAFKLTAENIRVPRAVLKAIPIVFFIGYMVPTGLLLVPVSENVTADIKQIIIAAWQPWPAFVSILLTTVHVLFSPFTKNDHTVEGGRATLSSLRWVYAFAFAHTTISHFVSWIFPLTAAIVPDLLLFEFRGPLHPSAVFGIPKPWEAVTVESVAAAVHAFLRWDFLIGSAGILIWAISLHRTAHRVVYGRAGCVGLAIKVAALTALAGPVGAAVELMWERDELVINELGGLKRAAPVSKKVA